MGCREQPRSLQEKPRRYKRRKLRYKISKTNASLIHDTLPQPASPIELATRL